MADTPADLARLLLEADHAVVLTGAGVSTESGIPDFRSRGGTWTENDPMKVATLSVFLTEPDFKGRPPLERLGFKPLHHACYEFA